MLCTTVFVNIRNREVKSAEMSHSHTPGFSNMSFVFLAIDYC